MTRTMKPARRSLMNRSALGLALALGVFAGGVTVSSPALAAKKPSFSFTKPFQAVAGSAQKAIDEAGKRADVVAATQKAVAAEQAASQTRTKAARDQANAAVDAAVAELGGLLTNEKGLLETAYAAIGNEDDRFLAGNLALSLGGTARDIGLQRRGLQSMLQSGKTSEADVGKFNFYVGRFSLALQDYPAAISAFQAAIGAGYRENGVDIMLVEALAASNQVPQALTALRAAVDRGNVSGTKVPEQWYMRGYQIAYKAKMADATNEWAAETARNYPSPFNWLGAFQLAREFGGYTSHEDVDLGRLIKRSGGLAYDPAQAGREYIEFIQAGVKWRLWPEVNAAIRDGVAAGAINPADPFVKDAQALSAAGSVKDAADLASTMRDAPNSPNGLTALGAGDLLLSAGDAARAEQFFQMALTKGGIDRDRALTRLGIALFDQGKYAEAKAAFGQVGGIRASMARLGAILAEQKAAPAPVAAPAG